MGKHTFVLFSFITLVGAAFAQAPVSLFDGKTLQGWKAITCAVLAAVGV